MTRRRVLVSPNAFQCVDDVLSAERGAKGQPSAADFVAIELPAIIERFATGWDELPELDGLSGGRVLVGPGVLVRAFGAYGMLLTDGSIEIVSITLDP